MAELANRLRPGVGQTDGFAWARDLRAREQGGLPLTEAQRQAWRNALNAEPVKAIGGFFNPISDEFLPPGMRKGTR
jgi:hypothetical protein